jgi:hypothetical protein
MNKVYITFEDAENKEKLLSRNCILPPLSGDYIRLFNENKEKFDLYVVMNRTFSFPTDKEQAIKISVMRV